VLSAGQVLLTCEHGSGTWRSAAGAGEDALLEALRACVAHLTGEGGLASRPARVTVQTWNGEPPVGSPAQALLERAGWRRDTPAMVWEPRNPPAGR